MLWPGQQSNVFAAKAKATKARERNLELGRTLINRRGAKCRKDHSLERAKALAALVLVDHEDLAAAGLRLTFPQLQEIEVKTLKSGDSRERISYADTAQCAEYLTNRIEEVRSVGEVLERIAEAMIATTLADEDELAQSRRVYCGVRIQDVAKKHLGAEIKAVRQRRSGRKSAK